MILSFFLQIQAEWCFSISKKGCYKYDLYQENYGNLFWIPQKKVYNITDLDH